MIWQKIGEGAAFFLGILIGMIFLWAVFGRSHDVYDERCFVLQPGDKIAMFRCDTTTIPEELRK